MKAFIHDESVYNTGSAMELVPIINQIIKPKSVVDVGCGLGTFLKIFKQQGVNDILGIDGKWVDQSLLEKNISVKEFVVADLETGIDIDREFDLAVSLEVAEHISENSADAFIRSLTKLSKVILFSAAVPGQVGYGHINEQWPAYWKKKFEQFGFQLHDVVRPLIWNNPNIFWWYKQNIFLVTHKDYGWVQKEFANAATEQALNVVHPELFRRKVSILESLQYGENKVSVYLKLLLKCLLRKFGLYKKPEAVY